MSLWSRNWLGALFVAARGADQGRSARVAIYQYAPRGLSIPPAHDGPRLPGRVGSIPRCVSTSVGRWVPFPRIHLGPLAKTRAQPCLHPVTAIVIVCIPQYVSALLLRSHRPFTRRRKPRWLQLVRSDVWGIFVKHTDELRHPPPRTTTICKGSGGVWQQTQQIVRSTPSGSEHLHPQFSRLSAATAPGSRLGSLERPNHGTPTPSRPSAEDRRQQTSAGHAQPLASFLSWYRI